MRKITVDGIEWKFRIGKQSTVIRNEKNKFVVFSNDLVGISPDDFDKGKYKGTSDGMVLPSQIAKFIQNKMK